MMDNDLLKQMEKTKEELDNAQTMALSALKNSINSLPEKHRELANKVMQLSLEGKQEEAKELIKKAEGGE